MKFIKQSTDLTKVCMSVCAAAALTASAWAGPVDGCEGCDHPSDCQAVSGEKLVIVQDGQDGVTFNFNDLFSDFPPGEAKLQIISEVQGQDGDGESHSVIMKHEVEDGDETIYLKIDGKEYTVHSMDEANEILQKHGLKGALEVNPPVLKNFPQYELHKSGQQDRQNAIEQPHAMLGVGLSPVEPAVRSYLGIDEGVGVMVANVIPGTPADEAGLMENDLITGVIVNGHDQQVDEQSFRKIIGAQEPGSEIHLQILRAGRAMRIGVELAKWDGEKLGVQFGQPGAVIQGFRPGQFGDGPNIDIMPREMLRQMMPNMPEDMKGMHQFRMQLDPKSGIWKWFNEDEEREEHPGDGHFDHPQHEEDNDDQDMFFHGDPDMSQMMEMMEMRMRHFEKRVEELMEQQQQMQRQMKRQGRRSKDGIDT